MFWRHRVRSSGLHVHQVYVLYYARLKVRRKEDEETIGSEIIHMSSTVLNAAAIRRSNDRGT